MSTIVGLNHYWARVTDTPPSVTPVPGATCTVRNADNTVATIYADALGATPKANPFTVPATSVIEFYGLGNGLNVQVSGTGVTTPYTINDVLSRPMLPQLLEADLPPASALLRGAMVEVTDGLEPGPYWCDGSDWLLIGSGGDTGLPLTTYAYGSLPSVTPSGQLAVISDRDRSVYWSTNASTWSSMSGQVFDVSHFGAKGDGVTDDTAAIQSAIDAMYRVVTTGGVTGILFIPKGRYLCGTLTCRDISAGIIIKGSGKDGTWFKLKNNTNAPLWDIGGTTNADLCTWLGMSDMSIDGNGVNQTVAAPVVRVRKADRCEFARIYVVGGKTHGFEFTSVSDTWCWDLESIANGGSGIYSDANSALFFYNCSSKQNARYHVENVFLNTGMVNPSTTDKRNCSVYVLGGSSEDDVMGCIINTTAWNFQVAQMRFAPAVGAYTAVEMAGSAEFCTIWGNRSQMSRNDTASTTGGANPGPYFFLKLGTQTANCQYWGNPLYHNGWDGANDFVYREQVLDLGQNYCMEREYFQPRMNASWSGNGYLGTTPVTVTNHCLWSRGIGSAPWVVSAGVVTASVPTYGNPFGAGSSTQVTYGGPANTLGYVAQDIAVVITAGEKWCFSLYLLCPSWDATKATDFQIRVTDNTSGALLSCTDVRANGNWERYGTTFVAQGNYTSVRVGLYKINGTGSQNTIAATCAQFSLGDLYTPFIETSAATAQTFAGATMTRVNVLTEVNFGSAYPTATTIGVAGGASALPATPLGYLLIYINGTERRIPYYLKP